MSGLYTSLVSQLIFPLHERLKRHSTVSVRERLEESQWWSADRIQALQLERLRVLLVEAGTHVPYYRRLFETLRFEPAAVRSFADLARLPFLTKSEIRAHSAALRHDHAPDLQRFNTGGSSGEPLIFFIGKERVSHDVAAKWRATRWWDVDIGDPEIVVWGSPIELNGQDRLRGLRDKALRTVLVPAFDMSEARLDQFVVSIRRRRPKMLFGYPSALSHIARHAEKRGERLDQLGIRVAFVTSEMLYDEQRADIGRVFGCPVANGYGGRDAGFIAHDCPAGRMHVTAEDIVVEIVDRGGHPVPRGETGEVVVTHLATRDFPFVRYKTGDIAALGTEPCPCGRGLPVLREINGRTTDFVVAADGTVLHGLALVYVLRDLPGVEQFKIVQESLGHTRVLLVANGDLPASSSATIVGAFRARLGADVDVTVEQVPAIPPERSGKYRYVVSRVDHPNPSRAVHA